MKVLNSLKKTLQQQVILRKFLVFMLLFTVWVVLVICGLTSNQHQVYSENLMAREQMFSNGTGSLNLKSQVYSPDSETLLLNFESKGQVGTALDPNNLTWKFYSKNRDVHAVMEVIPITDNKITVVIKNLQKNFEALAIQVTNSGVNTNDISVDLENSSSETNKEINKKVDTDKSNQLQFLITTKGKYLKYKRLANLTRPELVSDEIKKEIKFQVDQKVKLKKAIKDLKNIIGEDNSKISELQKEETYLTADQKDDNFTQINQLNSEIESYEKNIEQAQKNIKKADGHIAMLKKKDAAIKAGKFKFSKPIQVTHNN